MPLAMEILDSALSARPLESAPALRNVIQTARERIARNGLENLPALLGPLAEVTGTVTRAIVPADEGKEQLAGEVEEVITATRRKLTLLNDFFSFHIQTLQRQASSAVEAGLATEEEFVAAYPHYEFSPSTVGARLKEELGYTFQELAEQMGFPSYTPDTHIQLEEFLRARGLDQTAPDYIRNPTEVSPEKIMSVILEIEARGVPFRAEYWWWVNASRSQLELQIERTWKVLSRSKRLQELAELYDFDLEEAPPFIREGKEPDTFRVYCKIVSSIGHPIAAHWWGYKLSLPKFKEDVVKRLTAQKKDGSLTEAESTWLRNQRTLQALHRHFPLTGTKEFPLEIMAGEATSEELDAIQDLLALNDRPDKEIRRCIMAIVQRIGHRAELKQEMEKMLRKYRFGYADMDYFCETEERAKETLSRMQRLESTQEPVTRERLYDLAGQARVEEGQILSSKEILVSQ